MSQYCRKIIVEVAVYESINAITWIVAQRKRHFKKIEIKEKEKEIHVNVWDQFW